MRFYYFFFVADVKSWCNEKYLKVYCAFLLNLSFLFFHLMSCYLLIFCVCLCCSSPICWHLSLFNSTVQVLSSRTWERVMICGHIHIYFCWKSWLCVTWTCTLELPICYSQLSSVTLWHLDTPLDLLHWITEQQMCLYFPFTFISDHHGAHKSLLSKINNSITLAYHSIQRYSVAHIHLPKLNSHRVTCGDCVSIGTTASNKLWLCCHQLWGIFEQ